MHFKRRTTTHTDIGYPYKVFLKTLNSRFNQLVRGVSQWYELRLQTRLGHWGAMGYNPASKFGGEGYVVGFDVDHD